MTSWPLDEALGLLHRIIGREDGTITLLQMQARAIIVFFIGVVLIRLTTPRIFSKATPLDIVMSVIIGSNLSRTLTGSAPFVNVVIATTLLVAVHALLSHLASRWRPLANLLKGKPSTLVENGAIDWDAMQANAIGRRDLNTAIRDSGGKDVDEVELATMERGGDIQVVLHN